MRFLCVCVSVLSGLVAVRCYVFGPEPMKAARNILRGVLANDREWQTILSEKLNLGGEVFKEELAELGLTASPTGISAIQIIVPLVARKSVTGTELMLGIKVLGIALVNQFMITLVVHSHLATKYGYRSAAGPSGMRVCISKIQVALVNFASKAAFFGHPIDFFRQLNDDINLFLDSHKVMLDSTLKNMKKDIRKPIIDFLNKISDTTKNEVMKISHNYKNLDDNTIREIMNSLKLSSTELPPTIKKMNDHTLFANATEIDDYDQVVVSSIKLNFGEKRFTIVKHIPKV